MNKILSLLFLQLNYAETYFISLPLRRPLVNKQLVVQNNSQLNKLLLVLVLFPSLCNSGPALLLPRWHFQVNYPAQDSPVGQSPSSLSQEQWPSAPGPLPPSPASFPGISHWSQRMHTLSSISDALFMPFPLPRLLPKRCAGRYYNYKLINEKMEAWCKAFKSQYKTELKTFLVLMGFCVQFLKCP